MTEIFGRRRVPKIADGLSIISYYELWVGRWIPGDGPVLRDAVHAAVVAIYKLEGICTFDRDFDRIRDCRRVGL